MIRFEQALRWLATAGLALSAVAGALMGVFVALSAVMRYALGAPFRFTEEQVGLLFVSIVFLALPHCALNGRDISVTVIADRLPDHLGRIAKVLASLFTLAFAAVFATLAFDYAWLSYELDAKTDMANILIYPWQYVMVLSCALLGAVALAGLFRSAATSRTRR